LKKFVEVESLDEIKKKIDKYYMIMILSTVHPDFDHIRDQISIGHEVRSMESLATWLLRVPTL